MEDEHDDWGDAEFFEFKFSQDDLGGLVLTVLKLEDAPVIVDWPVEYQ